jgi:hypothetical protein
MANMPDQITVYGDYLYLQMGLQVIFIYKLVPD